MSACRECGKPVTAGNVMCAECAAATATDTAFAPPGTVGGVSQPRPNDVALGRHRYSDAYAVARTVVGLANTVKILGAVIGVLVALTGLIAAGQAGSGIGAAAAFSGMVSGASIGLSMYALGVLLAAVGQILRATLDTAVNTSPMLTQDEVRAIVSAN